MSKNQEFNQNLNELELGRFNRMRVVKEVEFGVYLDGGEAWGEILLPATAVPRGTEAEDELDVFIYLDSEDRAIATTIQPLAEAGDFAVLEVVDQNQVGAFLNWGLPGKDLLLPYREQTRQLKVGDRVVVFVTVDPKRDHIIASMRVDRFVSSDWGPLKPTNEVSLLICRKTDMGYLAIINNVNMGLIFASDVLQPLKEGDICKGYIKALRDDGKIDLTLQKAGYNRVEDAIDPILANLKAQGGFIAVTDKSSPEEIQKLFAVSKKTYKKSVGALFKRRLIRIETDGIYLV
ncbi:MAG: putative RNA-binding protein (virulence factor B family) [Candidatus Omnitrophota bacterium]|jgi:predicted RNA-binding protein (virulence factor B family)